MSSVLAASRYGASAPPRHVSGLSNDSRDLVPRQTSYDDDSFDADSSGGLQASAAHRRRAPRGSKLSLRKRDVRGGRRSKNLNGSSAAATDPLSKALSAAQRIQVSELKNEIESLALELEEIRKENKVLKRTVVIHEKSLGKYEDKGGDVAQLVERHSQETHALRELMKRGKDENRKLSKALRDAQEELEVTRKQLKKLQAIADNDNLAERDNLSRKLRAATDDLDKKNERIAELEKHIELLVKNHNRELNVETKRLRDVKAELDELQRKYSKLQPHAKPRDHGQASEEDASGAHTDRQPRDSSGAATAAAAAAGGSSSVSAAAAAVPAASSLRSEPRLKDGLTKSRAPRAADSSDEASDREFFLTNQTAHAAHARPGAGVHKVDSELDPSEHVSLRQGLDEGGRAVEARRQQPLTDAGYHQRQQQQPVRSSIVDYPHGAGVGTSELRRHHAAASDDATALKGHLVDRGSPLLDHQVFSANRGSLNEPALQLSSARGTFDEEAGAAPLAYRRRPAVEPNSSVKTESFDQAADRSKQHRLLHEPNSTDETLLSSSRDHFVSTSQKRPQPRHSNVLPEFMHTTDDSKWENGLISREQKIKPLSETFLQTTVVDDVQSARDRQRLQPAEKVDAANEAAAAEERRKKDLLLQKMKEIDRNRGFDSSVRPDASLPLHPQPPIAAEAHSGKGAGVLAGADRLPDNDADAPALRPGAPERRDRLLKLLRIDASDVEATAAGKAQLSRPADESSSSSSYQPTFLSSGDRQPPAVDARPPRRSNIISELFGADDGKKATVKSTFDDDDDLIGEPAGRLGQAPAGRGAAGRPGAKVHSDDAPLVPPLLAGGARPRGKYAGAAPPASFISGLGGGVDNHDIDDIEVLQL